MKVNVSAELTADEVISGYLSQELKKNGVDFTSGKVKVLVQNKAGEWVDVASEKVKLVFSN